MQNVAKTTEQKNHLEQKISRALGQVKINEMRNL